MRSSIPPRPFPLSPGLAPPGRTPRRGPVLLTVLLLWACGEAPPPESDPPNGGENGDPALIDIDRDRVYDRELAFVSDAGSPVLVVPWFFRTRVEHPDAIHEHRVWFAGPDGWESLVNDTLVLPAGRSPWRILPGPRVRLVVGDAERLEALVLRDPVRELETRPSDFVTEWSPAQGEAIRLFRAEAALPSTRVDGFVVDITRAWRETEDSPGDWIFLHAGDDLQFFMEELGPVEATRSGGTFRAWTRVDHRDAQWPTVEVTWEDLRSFERARRDTPGGWSFAGPGERVVGQLRPVSSHLVAGEGDGPLLPVTGLYEVEGTLQIEGREFDVVGLVRHLQH